MYPKKANITCKAQFSLQNYLGFIMKVPLFSEIKVYSNHKPQLFPEDAGVRWVSPFPRASVSCPACCSSWGWGCVDPGDAEPRIRTEQGVWERERHGITGDISWNGSKVCPSFPDRLYPDCSCFHTRAPPRCAHVGPAPTGSLPNTHRQHLILQCVLIALTTLYFAIFVSSRNQGWSEGITGGTWLI